MDKLKGQIGEFEWSFGKAKTNRTSIINHLITKYKLDNYLEIGIRNGSNFNKIDIFNKIGIDPQPKEGVIIKDNVEIIKKTSDEYFNNLEKNKRFDLIFIDGLHLEYQVDRDINNSLKHLNDNGFIVIHDCNPPTKFHQRDIYIVDGKFPAWNGTVWKSFVKKRMNDKNLNMCVVNTDWGVGIIQKGKQKLYESKQNLSYDNFEINRKKVLNLISVTEFLEIY